MKHHFYLYSFHACIRRKTSICQMQLLLIFDIDRIIMFYIVTVIFITQALMFTSVYALGKCDLLILFKLSKFSFTTA